MEDMTSYFCAMVQAGKQQHILPTSRRESGRFKGLRTRSSGSRKY